MLQPDDCEPSGTASVRFAARFGRSAGPRLETLITLQPAEVLDVFRAFRGEGGIERNFFAAFAAGGATGSVREICVRGDTPDL